MWNEDEVKGKAEQAKGAIKKKTGELVGDEQLQGEGAADKVKGEARETGGRIERGIDEAADKTADKTKKALDR